MCHGPILNALATRTASSSLDATTRACSWILIGVGTNVVAKRKDSGAQILFLVQESLPMRLRSAQILMSGLAGVRSSENRAVDTELQTTKDYIAVVTDRQGKEPSTQCAISCENPALRTPLRHDRSRCILGVRFCSRAPAP